MPETPSPGDIQKRVMIRDNLQQQAVGSLDDRVKRFLSVDHLPLIPSTSFAAASAECLELFRDAQYYGCISLCQAVGEALVRFLCEANSFSPKKVFEKNLELLRKRGFVDESFEATGRLLWSRRDDFHHMNSSVPNDLQELSRLAKEKIEALCELESWVFSFETRDGKIVPKKPKYWSGSEDGKSDVFLRIS